MKFESRGFGVRRRRVFSREADGDKIQWSRGEREPTFSIEPDYLFRDSAWLRYVFT